MTGPASAPARKRILIAFALLFVAYVPAVVALLDLRSRNRADIGVLTQRLPELLLDFELAIGYSGFIHDFKNAVLRGDEPQYADGVRESYDAAMRAMLSLEQIAGDVGLEIDLGRIQQTLNDYRKALIRVEHGHRIGLSAEEIDELVRIPDAAATLNLVTAHEAIQAALIDRTVARGRDITVLFGVITVLLLVLPATVIGLMWSGIRNQARRMEEIRDLNHVLDERNGELLKTNTALKRINDNLNEFAHVTAHDLRVPMRGIANHASFLIEDHGDHLPAEVRTRLTRMQDLCSQVENLTATLLKYSRIDRGDASENVQVGAVLADIRSALAELMEARNAEIVVDTPLPALGASVAEVNTVFHNLILNGLLYSDADQPTVHVGFVPHVRAKGRQLNGVFYVRDNGIGIAPEFHEDVFRMFKRLNHPGAYSAGSGAGLAFVRKVVETRGGQVILVSGTGEGSTFYIDFGDAMVPARPTEAEDMPMVQHA